MGGCQNHEKYQQDRKFRPRITAVHGARAPAPALQDDVMREIERQRLDFGVGAGWIDQLVAWPLLRQRPFPAVLFA